MEHSINSSADWLHKGILDGAVRKHIDYDSVFAPAPHLESAKMFRAFEVLLGWNAVDFDINQAYLIGNISKPGHGANSTERMCDH